MHGRHAIISSFTHRSSGAFVPSRLLIAEGRDNHSAFRRSFFSSAAAVHNLALHKPLAFVRQKTSSAGLRMSVLDSVPLVFANGNSPQAPPSAPLLCLLFSAQWCPGKLLVSLVYFESCCEVVLVSRNKHHSQTRSTRTSRTTTTVQCMSVVLLYYCCTAAFVVEKWVQVKLCKDT